MGIRLATFLRSRNGKCRFIDPALAAAAVICAVMLVRAAAWRPVYVNSDKGSRGRVTVQRGAIRAVSSGRSYDVIVEKDIFREVRKKIAPPKPAVAQPPPPPALTLIGTVLLDDGQAAIMDFPGRGHGSTYFRAGDVIEGFVIKEIRKDSVQLERNGEGLKVYLRQGAPSLPAASGAPEAQTAPFRPPSRLPPQFPPPQAR